MNDAQIEISKESIRHGHETRDIDARKLFWFVIGFLICAIVIHAVIAWLFLYFARQQEETFAAETPMVRARSEWTYPALQISPADDFQQFREKEERLLHSYGWVNRETGVVRIPIERAIEILIRENSVGQPSPQIKQKGES